MRNLSPGDDQQQRRLRTHIRTFTMRAFSDSSAKKFAHCGPSRSSSTKKLAQHTHTNTTPGRKLSQRTPVSSISGTKLARTRKTPDLGTFPCAGQMHSRMRIEQAKRKNYSYELIRL